MVVALIMVAWMEKGIPIIHFYRKHPFQMQIDSGLCEQLAHGLIFAISKTLPLFEPFNG